jgi:hypothetical protein
MRRFMAFFSLVLLCAPPLALAQSQAINGTIEGVVQDPTGAALPGVTVTVTQLETGARRVLTTAADGSYRALLLPLGSYRVRAELQGFKAVEQAGIQLSAGQTLTIDAKLEVGGIQEVVQVTAESPVTQPARIDLGRTITEAEVKNLPNVARNPYNFGLLQPNVTGYENEEFGATRMNANGSQMRTNYQIDGSSATQKDRAGLRMFQPSETMIKEVQVVSSGFAPEFGQTTGMVYNVVTPSGANTLAGSASYRFRRDWTAERPFLLAANRPKPDLKVDNFTATLGGPIKKDKLFFYLGYEYLKNDLSANRVITVTPETASVLGLSPEALGDGVIPAVQSVDMFIAKLDYQVSAAHRLSARYSLFKNTTPENIGGGLNTREIGTDFQDRMDNFGFQAVSTFGSDKLNELRIAYGKRDNPLEPSAAAGSGPEVQVTGVANFGGAPTPTEFIQKYWQVVDNFSLLRGRHTFKIGFDVQLIDDERLTDIHPLYVFPNTAAYLAAKGGVNPYSYTRFSQNIGDASVSYSQTFFSAFVQDEFRVNPRLKLIYGVRYDRFKVPDADPSAPYAANREFRVDGNNFGPRVGFSWSLDAESRTVLRASTGVMYETPLGLTYQDALLEGGAPRLLPTNVGPTQPGAPAFPGTLSSLPPGTVPSRSIRAVAADFDSQWAWLSNVQLDRALTRDLAVGVGYINSTGRSLPTLLNSNVVPIGPTLPDGRPIYSRSVSAATRVDPNFDIVREITSTGESQYNALTVSLSKRMSHGWQLTAFYTYADAKDDGVIGGRYVIGSSDVEAISDPSDQGRDYSYTSWNVKHTFVVSGVLQPVVQGEGFWNALANNNLLAFIVQTNSGLPYNIRAATDLNADGISADRPNGVERQSGELGSYFQVDGRYSRFIPIGSRVKAELFLEAKNLFNRENIRAVNSVVATDALGNPNNPIPSEFPVTQTYEPRQFQLGVKVQF